MSVSETVTFSPVCALVTARCTPELERVQAELGARTSFRDGARILESLLPASHANQESLRTRTHAVALQLEAAGRQAAAEVTAVRGAPAKAAAADDHRPVVVLDGAYIRALVRSAAGGPVEPILDWFHLSKRVQHVEQVMGGLCALEPPLVPLDRAPIDVERLRHLPWNGHHEKACEALGRIASWAKDAVVPKRPAAEAKARRLAARGTELRAYIKHNEGALIDYGQRHRAGKPISTSRAEGTVNQLVSARMHKRRQMRWSLRGAHRVLQVRAAELDGRFGHPAIQFAA